MRKLKLLCKSCKWFSSEKETFIFKRRRLPDILMTRRTPYCGMSDKRIREYIRECYWYIPRINILDFMEKPKKYLKRTKIYKV